MLPRGEEQVVIQGEYVFGSLFVRVKVNPSKHVVLNDVVLKGTIVHTGVNVGGEGEDVNAWLTRCLTQCSWHCGFLRDAPLKHDKSEDGPKDGNGNLRRFIRLCSIDEGRQGMGRGRGEYVVVQGW